MEIMKLILLIILWSAVLFLVLLYLKKCYVPYRPGKISIIMYGEDYYDAMIGVPGKKVQKDGKIIDYEQKGRKGILWGLIPGRLYLYPFFYMKDDIELMITEKKDASLVTSEDQVISKNRSIAVVKRTVITDYLQFETTYYFGFKQLETGNDHIKKPTDDNELEGVDFSKFEDEKIEEFSNQLNQLLVASNAIQSRINDFENMDIEIAVGDVVQITNVWQYLYQQKSWYPPKETLLKSAMREFCAERTYSSLITMQTSTAEIVIKKENEDIPLATHLNVSHEALNLGHKSLKVMVEEVDLGEDSREIKNSLEKIQEAKRTITKKLYESISGYIDLNLFSKKIGLVKNAILEIKGKVNATVQAKWNSISGMQSKLTHYFGGNGDNEDGDTDIAYFQKIFTMLAEKEKKEVTNV